MKSEPTIIEQITQEFNDRVSKLFVLDTIDGMLLSDKICLVLQESVEAVMERVNGQQ